LEALIGALFAFCLAAPGDGPGELWAFAPLADAPLPAVEDLGWPREPIDRFLLAALEERGLAPAAPATRRTLFRRASFDLAGLPPADDEVEAFVADRAPDAWERLVDRLLASPRYGERWGRHWLDVARYADSNGLDENIAHGNAWRYRDYVIAAFNADKPYDVFLAEQIAGDLLAGDGGAEERQQRLIATGFLSMGPKVLAEGDQAKMELDIIDEQIDTLGKAVLGLTLGCARCHDHKFDPIRTQDYYALAGIFKSTRTMESFARIARWHEHSLASEEELARAKAHQERIAAKKQEIEAAKKAGDAPAGERLGKELAELERSAPELPAAMGVARADPADLHVLARGDHLSPGERVARAIPAALPGAEGLSIAAGESGRLELARWLAGGGRRITARVMANRIWRWHFGAGLARSPDNFGRLGERPDHPLLLDWLARRFIASGWSVKDLHRRILSSRVYRMGGEPASQGAAELDPDGRLLWRFAPRRLEAEEIRDALLAASGSLDLSMGGSMLHVKNREFLFDHTSKDGTSYASRRRSIYLPIIRNHLQDVLALFDFPDPAVVGGDRASTTVASQALFLMNGELALETAERLALDVLSPQAGAEATADPARLEALYRRALARPPGGEEVRRDLAFIAELAAGLDAAVGDAARRRILAWAALAQALLISNEFLHVE
jgi:hypothetical protein